MFRILRPWLRAAPCIYKIFCKKQLQKQVDCYRLKEKRSITIDLSAFPEKRGRDQRISGQQTGYEGLPGKNVQCSGWGSVCRQRREEYGWNRENCVTAITGL